MSILNIDGFDDYNVVSDTLAGWTSNWSCSFLPQIVLNPGRYGGQCMYISAGGGQENSIRNFNWTTNTLQVGFDYRNASGIASFQLLNMAHQAGGVQFYVVTDATGHISVYRGTSVLLGTSSVAIVTNTWSYIEIAVFVHPTAGTVDVWQDGVHSLSLTGQNTQGSGTTDQINQMTIYESGLCSWDNMYWSSAIGGFGPMSVVPIVPSSDNQVSGYTAVGATNLWDCVDELTPDGDTTYITSSTAGDHAAFGYGSLSAAVIKAVQLNMVAKKSDAGLRSIGVYETDGTNNLSGSALALTTSYAAYNDVLSTAPDGTAWTPAKYNAASFGVATIV